MSAHPEQQVLAYIPAGEGLATSGQPTEEQIRDIAAAGYRTVINLAMPTSPGALADEQKSVETAGMEYIGIPVDFTAPTADHYERFEKELRQRAATPVWVHCALNYRVSAFIAAYRVRVLGWDPEMALAALRQIWEPDAIWADWLTQQLRRPR